jgi:hypothetical protein
MSKSRPRLPIGSRSRGSSQIAAETERDPLDFASASAYRRGVADMDATLKALLDARERWDEPPTAAEASVLELLCEELPRLSDLTDQEWDAKLAHIANDVSELGQEADRAAAQARALRERHERAQQGLEMIADLAARRMSSRSERPRMQEEGPVDALDDPHDRPFAQAVREASTTRDAVLALLRSDPGRGWTPQFVYDELRRAGRATGRNAVQTYLQRAVGGDVRRVGSGVYALADTELSDSSSSTAHSSRNGSVARLETRSHEDRNAWMTPETLNRIAEEAQACFLANHPGEADPEVLVEEAKRRIGVWIERNRQDPYDEAHVLRLAKTALDDWHRRKRKSTRLRITGGHRLTHSVSP